MDQMYHNGVMTASQYLEYTSCEDSRSESEKAVDFINKSNRERLESLRKVIQTSESHILADEILGLFSKGDRALVLSSQKSFSTKRTLSLPYPGRYKHFQIYVGKHCDVVVELHRKKLLNLLEVKFGIQEEQWKVDKIIESLIHSGQQVYRDNNTIVFVCQGYKIIAFEMEHSSYDDTFAQVKAEALQKVLCETLHIPFDSVKIRNAFERSETWVLFVLPLDVVFRLMTGVLDVIHSKAIDKNLSLFLPRVTAVRMHVGGLPSLSLRPIRRIDGDWSNTGAAIAIPGSVSQVLACRSSGAYLVNVESNEVEEAVGDNLDVLRDCTALVSVGDKMYAFGCRLYEVTYKPLDSSFRCIQLGDENWSGTLTACRYGNAILAVRKRTLMFGLISVRTDFCYVSVNTGAPQVLSASHNDWSDVCALVNVVDDEGKDNVIAICHFLWKVNITVIDGVVTHLFTTKLSRGWLGRLGGVGPIPVHDRGWTATNIFYERLFPFDLDHCLEYVCGRAWQFTRSAAVHRKTVYVATDSHYLPRRVLGGLFRVDPFPCGAYWTVYKGLHIHTVVDANRYLVVFTTNELYVLDVD